jgi:signal transduction histidine kinase
MFSLEFLLRSKPLNSENFRTRHGRLMILALAFGSVAMMSTIWWYYTRQRGEVESFIARDLAAVADVEATQIENWRGERLGDGHVLSSSRLIGLARNVLARPGSDAAAGELMDVLGRMARAFQYTDATVVSMDGSSVIRLAEDANPGSSTKKAFRAHLANDAIAAGDVILADLTLDTRTGSPLMYLVVPVPSVGAIILDIDPSAFLYPYLEKWPGPSATAETMLVRKEGDAIVYLSKRRHAPNAAPFERRPFNSLNLPQQAVDGPIWSGMAVDYRGVPVLGTVRRIKDSPWHLATKIDTAEVTAALRRLSWELLFMAALIGLTTIAGVAFVIKDQRAVILQSFSGNLIEAQEQERRRLARELHDDVNQQIAALNFGIGNVQRAVPPNFSEIGAQCDRIQARLVQLSDTVRRLSHELHPAVLEYSGLGAALKQFCDETAEASGIETAFEASGAVDKVSPAVALCIYRVAQEALQNVIKHANASKVSVVISERNDVLYLAVIDDGRGIDWSNSKTKGLGLVSMMERTLQVNGKLHIDSKPNRGTMIRVRVPA